MNRKHHFSVTVGRRWSAMLAMGLMALASAFGQTEVSVVNPVTLYYTDAQLPTVTNIAVARNGDLANAANIPLNSSDTNLFVVPSSVTFNVGQGTNTFALLAKQRGLGTLTFTPVPPGYTASNITVDIRSPLDFAVNPTPVVIVLSNSVTEQIELVRRGRNPGDLNVNLFAILTSQDTGVFTVPANAFFPADPAAIEQTNLVTLTGVAEGLTNLVVSAAGYPTNETPVYVFDTTELSLALQPDPLSINLGLGALATAEVVRAGLFAGDLNHATTVTLTSANAAYFTNTAQVVFTPTNTMFQTNTFLVHGVNAGITSLLATASGYRAATSTVQVLSNVTYSLAVTPSPVNVITAGTTQVSLSRNVAPSGPLGDAVTFTLTSLNPLIFTVTPPNFTLDPTNAASQTYTNIQVTGVATGTATLLISSSDPGKYPPTNVTVNVSATPPVTTGFLLPPVLYVVSNAVRYAPAIRLGGFNNDFDITLTVSNPAALEVKGNNAFGPSDTLTFPAGNIGAAFAVQGVGPVFTTTTLTASSPGFPDSYCTVYVVTNNLDRDDDDLPDWWEYYWFGNLWKDADGDPDNDGLNNWNEYLAGTDPDEADTNGDGIDDGYEDSDGDGLDNLYEQDFETRPDRPDTDDDNVLDSDEVFYVTSPIQPMSVVESDPELRNMAKRRGLDMGATPSGGVTLPKNDRFDAVFSASDGWCIESWVYLDANNPDLNGDLIAYDADFGDSVRFSLTNGSPQGLILNAAGQVAVRVGGPLSVSGGTAPLALGRWSHLALVWRPQENSFELFRDGALLYAQMTLYSMRAGTGTTYMARGFDSGYLDEVRVWDRPQSWRSIDTWKNRLYPNPGYVNLDGEPGSYTRLTSARGLNDFTYHAYAKNRSLAYSYRGTYLYGNLKAYYRFDDFGAFIEDFAHLLDEDYWLIGPMRTNTAARIVGVDDGDGDGLPEWWTRMHGLEQWPDANSGPSYSVSDYYTYPVTYLPGVWVTQCDGDEPVEGISKRLYYYSRTATNNDTGVTFPLYNIWLDIDPTTNADPNAISYPGRAVFNDYDVPIWADYYDFDPPTNNPAWFTPLGAAGNGNNIWFNDRDGSQDYSEREDIWIGSRYFSFGNVSVSFGGRERPVYGSVGNNHTTLWNEDSVYVGAKDNSATPFGKYITVVKYFYLTATAKVVHLDVKLDGIQQWDMHVNETLYNQDADTETNILRSLLRTGRNRIVVRYLGQDGSSTFNDAHYCRDITKDSTATKFDLELSVNNEPIIVRGDDTYGDPRAAWHMHARATAAPYWLLNPADKAGRILQTNANYGLPNNPDGTWEFDRPLDNYYEFRALTNPQDVDSDNNGVLDSDEDYDGDAVANWEEAAAFSDPNLRDTDDDGVDDAREKQVWYTTNPDPPGNWSLALANSLNPFFNRAARFYGATNDFIEYPTGLRFALPEWTLEMWVRPVLNANTTATLLRRTVGPNGHNYWLGLSNRYFTVGLGTNSFSLLDEPIPETNWTHLAASFSSENRVLKLYRNGELARTYTTPVGVPVGGGGAIVQRIGESYNGLLDEVRFWSTVLPQSSIVSNLNLSLTGEQTNLVAYYRFDDGTSGTNGVGVSMKPGWTEGQVQDFVTRYPADWNSEWLHAATLVGSAALTTNLLNIDPLDGDTDGDGMPDWWELLYGLDPFDATGDNGASGDPDGDGLNNLNEYRAQTNPRNADTNGNDTSDAQEDADGDGLSNIYEQNTSQTRVDMPDTDDDGLNDREEVDQALSPIDSISPYVMRYLTNNGTGYLSVPEVESNRFNSTAWTIEATVKLNGHPTTNVTLITRAVAPSNYVTFELGIATTRLPYVRFQTDRGIEYRVDSYVRVEPGEWVTLAGRYGADDERSGHSQLALFQDSERIARDVTDNLPATGSQLGAMELARGLHGAIDEVRIWGVARSDTDLAEARGQTLLFGPDIVPLGVVDMSSMAVVTRAYSSGLSQTSFTAAVWFKTAEEGTLLERENVFDLAINDSGRIEATLEVQALLLTTNATSTNTCSEKCALAQGALTIDGVVDDLRDNQWHFAALVVGGESVDLYVDNQNVGSREIPPPVSQVLWEDNERFGNTPSYCDCMPSAFTLRSDNSPLIVGQTFTGLVDEVRMFDRALTTSALIEQAGRKVLGEEGLIVYLDMDGESSNTTEVADRATSNVYSAVLSSGARLLVGATFNAPVTVIPVDELRDRLTAYFPMDDGRAVQIFTNRDGQVFGTGAFSVEDFLHRNEYAYAGSLLPDLSAMDFYPSVNPYTNFGCAMCFPRAFPLADDSPWRTDSDGDGMPDIFEQYYGLDPNSAINRGPRDDLDGDGLFNLYEYYAGTDPTFWCSFGNGLSDVDADPDDDGLSNDDEQALGTHPMRRDTDDDGFSDFEEAHLPLFSNPIDSMDPRNAVNQADADRRTHFKSMVLNGVAHAIPIPTDERTRFNATNWTVECWVKTRSPNANGSLFRYVGEIYSNGAANVLTYYQLQLVNGSPQIVMRTTSDQNLSIGGEPSLALPTNKWIHLAGVFDDVNDALSLYVNGIQMVKLQVFESAMSGSQTADRFPGRAYLGDAGLYGNIDEVRVWNIARADADIERGMFELIQSDEAGQICNFRFDDGRRMVNNVEVSDTSNDPFGPGRGAEDFVYRMDGSNLETPWEYALLNIQFDYTNAVLATRWDYVDEDHDKLPDGWEGRRFGYTVRFIEPTAIAPFQEPTQLEPLAYTYREQTVRGNEYPAANLFLLGWGQDVTPIMSLDGPYRRWINSPDGGWMIKDIWVQEDVRSAEMRVAIDGGDDARVYVNGQLVDLGDIATRATFTFSETIAPGDIFHDTITRYVVLTNMMRGHNRFAVQVINEESENCDQQHCFFEYFNMELVVNGTNFYIRRGDDTGLADKRDATWWTFFNASSAVEPPNDWEGNGWTNISYGLDIIGDLDNDGLNNFYEALVHTNPKAQDSDGDGVLDPQEDFDGDGLSNLDEQMMGSDPRLPDTDDDGLADGFEKSKATNPADALSPDANYALQLNGAAGSHLEMPYMGRLTLSNDWTLMAWVKPAAIATNTEVLAREVSPGRFNYYLGWWGDGTGTKRPCASFTASPTGPVVRAWGSNAIPTDVWTHMAATYSATSGALTLYVNGRSERTVTAAGRPLYNDLALPYGRVGRNFNGAIDEIGIFDRVLNPAELATNTYAKIRDLLQPDPAGTNAYRDACVGYYGFDDRTGVPGVSGIGGWNEGQVQDFTPIAFTNDWSFNWANAASFKGSVSMIPNRINPGVLYVTSPNMDGVYYPGQTIMVHVVFSRAVAQVVGTPYIQLQIEGGTRNAPYRAQPAVDTLEFRYSIQDKDWSWDLDYVAVDSLKLNSGAIRYEGTSNFDLTLPAPGSFGSLGWNKDLLVDPPDYTDPYIQWKQANFGTPAVGGEDDPDGDGMSNYAEFLAGTDPNSRESALLIDDVRLDGTRLIVTWRAVEDKTYSVQCSESILSKDWQTPAGWNDVIGTGAVMTLTGEADAPRMKVYRVIVNP